MLVDRIVEDVNLNLFIEIISYLEDGKKLNINSVFELQEYLNNTIGIENIPEILIQSNIPKLVSKKDEHVLVRYITAMFTLLLYLYLSQQ